MLTAWHSTLPAGEWEHGLTLETAKAQSWPTAKIIRHIPLLAICPVNPPASQMPLRDICCCNYSIRGKVGHKHKFCLHSWMALAPFIDNKRITLFTQSLRGCKKRRGFYMPLWRQSRQASSPREAIYEIRPLVSLWETSGGKVTEFPPQCWPVLPRRESSRVHRESNCQPSGGICPAGTTAAHYHRTASAFRAWPLLWQFGSFQV